MPKEKTTNDKGPKDKGPAKAVDLFSDEGQTIAAADMTGP